MFFEGRIRLCSVSVLGALINEMYDERIRKYVCGEKVWDFSAGITLAVSGRK